MQLHKKAYTSVVCEFGGFENVLHDVSHMFAKTKSTDVIIIALCTFSNRLWTLLHFQYSNSSLE